MKRILCFFVGFHRTLCNILDGEARPTSGHKFKLKYENEDVQILECQRCGYSSVGYFFNPDEV